MHALVENFEDKSVLDDILKTLNAAQKKNKEDWWEELGKEDQLPLEESLAQYKPGR